MLPLPDSHGEAFNFTASGTRPQPEFDYEGIDRESDPEGNAEELPWLKVSDPAGREENAHDRARCGDSEKNANGPGHPAKLQPLILAQLPGTKK